ncbi:MAG: hypothetical protein HYU99_00065 [Deltaproteobacteria bacterium]|nr:hypothetical protein [Deltaproteobacteria bacterium]
MEAPATKKLDSSLELNEENTHILGGAFWNLVRLYGLGRREQATLLGVNPNNRKSLKDYEQKKAIPLDPDKFLRVGFLLGIHKNLRILFPQNVNIVYHWMTTRQELFHHKTPMEFIEENPANSLLHLATVRRALDILRTGF